MKPLQPPCPFLPVIDRPMDWRDMAAHREGERGAEFYRASLEYSQQLWQRTLPARAILCLDRAFGADLRGDESVLREWPLPYAATAWMLQHAPAGVFIGNPRVHFQHYADRMNEPRREQRRWRAWACWALTRTIMPELPADPKHAVVEPTTEVIVERLTVHGFPGEAELWRDVCGQHGSG